VWNWAFTLPYAFMTLYLVENFVPSSDTGVNNVWSWAFSLPYAFMTLYLVKNRHKYTCH
jgi:hypothetical protein